MIDRRKLLSLVASTPIVGTIASYGPGVAYASQTPSPFATPQATSALANLSHLRWLLGDVPLEAIEGHTTYRIDESPVARAPWTYANWRDDGSYQLVGGGDLDPQTDHYTQGAYNADDIARAAVVFLRDWLQNNDDRSRIDAYETLRALAYLQVVDGPNTGRVVLWQQADGSLNPSAQPIELPDPSDSDESYWMARTLWAFGEGYAAFKQADPVFAAFLKDRLELAIASLEQTSLGRYGEWLVADGERVPGWLINNGADATAEAVLGLAAFLEAEPEHETVRNALIRYAEGIAAMSLGGNGRWPFGALMPWALSRSFWHAWGAEAPAALARVYGMTGNEELLDAAVLDIGAFTPQLLTSGGPFNAWSPLPGEAQIAFGAEGRIAGALAVADQTGGEGLELLAGIMGGWFFGANPAGQPVYDPATGVTFDGVEPDGGINKNAGAESTIHGQLAMLALDAHPLAARVALAITGHSYRGLHVVEAESAQDIEAGDILTPDSAWTGESNWSGSYLRLEADGSATIPISNADGAYIHAVINALPEESGTSTWYAVTSDGEETEIGRLPNGGLGDAGITEAPGRIRPVLLPTPLPDGTVAVKVTTDGAMELDAILVQPSVGIAVYSGPEKDIVLYANATSIAQEADSETPHEGESYSARGLPEGAAGGGRVEIPAEGFAITRWQ